MKRILAAGLVMLLLTGCNQQTVQEPMKLRTKLYEKACSFRAVVDADYGEVIYQFAMDCQADTAGNLKFQVVTPESISGITGTISEEKGNLTFDEKILAFPVISEGQVTPVTAPWHLLHTLRSGYIAGCGQDENYTRVMLDDSFSENPLHLDCWLDQDENPVRGEILYKGRRILTVHIEKFRFL